MKSLKACYTLHLNLVDMRLTQTIELYYFLVLNLLNNYLFLFKLQIDLKLNCSVYS